MSLELFALECVIDDYWPHSEISSRHPSYYDGANPWLPFQGANIFSNRTVLGLDFYKHFSRQTAVCLLLIFLFFFFLPFLDKKILCGICTNFSHLVHLFKTASLKVYGRDKKIELKFVPFCTVPNTLFLSAWNLMNTNFTNCTPIRILAFKTLTKNHLLSSI